MSATVVINRLTGGGPTYTPITSINTRANAEDAHTTAGTSNSILIPTSGTNYSYWVTTQLEVTAITGGTVNNLRWYTDGSNGFGTGVTCTVGAANGGSAATGYVTAPGVQGTSGTLLSTGNHSGLVGSPVDAFSYTSGSPMTLNNGTGSQTSTSTVQKFGNLVVYQIAVGTTAASGATPSETFTWKYDDTSS